MRVSQRLRNIFAACVAVLACFAARRAPAAELVRHPNTFIYAQGGEVVSLDPAYSYDGVSHGLIFNVYDTLLAFEGETNDRIVPRLAAAVPSTANGLIAIDRRTYTFPIRKGVTFHDGTVLTPEDVRYSLLRFMLTDPSGGPVSLLLDPILGVASTRDASGKIQVRFEDAAKAVRVEGDKVIIRLHKPFAPFLTIMARWSYVMSKSWAQAHGDWDGSADTWERFNNPPLEQSYFFGHMNGTGPFMLERWDRQVKRVYLKRFDRYWAGPAKLGQVVLATVPEFSTRKLMLQAGDADLIDVTRSFLGQLQGLPGVRIVDHLPRLMTDPALFFTFDINPTANPDIGSGKLDGDGIPPNFFMDKNLRKAFAYSFDYDAFLKDVSKGTAQRPRGPVPPAVLGSNPRGPHYSLDLLKAAQYFKRAWNGQVWERGFKFTITHNTSSEGRQVACEILKKNVESVNPKFRVDIRGVEWPSFLDKGQRRLMPLFARGWTADYPDAHNFMFAFYHSQGRYPSAQNFSDPDMDRMIDAAMRELDPKKREHMYWKISERGFEEAPSILVAHPTGVYAMRSWVQGFYDNAVFMGIYYYPLEKKGKP